MSSPSEWWASVRCRAQGAVENGSAIEGPPRIEVAATADMLVNTAAVLRSLGRTPAWFSALRTSWPSAFRGS